MRPDRPETPYCGSLPRYPLPLGSTFLPSPARVSDSGEVPFLQAGGATSVQIGPRSQRGTVSHTLPERWSGWEYLNPLRVGTLTYPANEVARVGSDGFAYLARAATGSQYLF